ncbi:MAG: sensor domain-containing diguanylate cyclase [Myxococcota bacterium]
MTAETEAVWRSRATATLRALRGAVGRPFASLPSRIMSAVSAAALLTSFAVAYTSTHTTEAFLRRKIDERFPEILARTAERIDDWYVQRELDIATFARSDTVADSVSAGTRRDRVAREEARKYLAYVREGFPQYASLFVLDASGARRVQVGEQPGLPESLLERLTRKRGTGSGTFFRVGSDRYQFISAPIERSGKTIGSLHAMIPIDAIERLMLGDSGRDTATRIFLVGEAREIVAHSHGAALRTTYPRDVTAVAPGAKPAVQDYVTAAGEHVVGTAIPLTRFGWGLVVEESYDVAFAPVVSVQQRIVAINLSIVVACVLLAFLIGRSIVQPIHALSESARRIADGETDVALPAAEGHDEIAILSAALSEMIQRQQTANEDLRRSNEMLEQLSLTDDLTKLHNHRYFQDRLGVETRRANRSGDELALLLVDIDDFKALNDRYGHAVGDEVLRQVAEVLNVSVRETDLPARYGGEEFAVLAPRTGVEGAMTLAEKLRGAIAESAFRPDGVDDEALQVTVSIGVALYDGDEKRFFNAADRALYQAKANGKDCAVFDEPRAEA